MTSFHQLSVFSSSSAPASATIEHNSSDLAFLIIEQTSAQMLYESMTPSMKEKQLPCPSLYATLKESNKISPAQSVFSPVYEGKKTHKKTYP